jgi:large subunit ribosomal protein L29
MKAAEIRAMNDEQIEGMIGDLKEEWRKHRFDDAVGRLTHNARIGQIKRDIARLKTIQTERKLAEDIEALISAGKTSRK